MRMRCGKSGCAVARELRKARQNEGVRVPTNLDKAKPQIQQPPPLPLRPCQSQLLVLHSTLHPVNSHGQYGLCLVWR